MRDLALLLGCFLKFCGIVVLQAAAKDFEDFGSGFARGANDEDAVEAPFVSAVGIGKSEFYIFLRYADFFLFLVRPRC